MIATVWLYSTISPGCARMRATVPSHGDLISFMVFIASMMNRVSPSLTFWPTSTNGGASGEGAE